MNNYDMNEIVVSICCLTYNHVEYIRQTLEGFLMQKTEFAYEIIVHDDASTDGTVEILEEYEKKYPELFHLIYQSENTYSKNIDSLKEYVFPIVRGRYIAYCEGDDYWTDSNKLQKQISYMELHDNCSLTFHAANYLKSSKIVKNDRRFKNECEVTVEQMIIGDGGYCASASLCFRTEYALEYPCYRIISDVGDYPLQLLLATKGTVHYFPEIMCVYRIGHGGSWVTNLKDINKFVNHLKIKIAWMQEFDRETQKQYHQTVLFKNIYDMIVLYRYDELTLKEINTYLKQLNFGKKKMYLWIFLVWFGLKKKIFYKH